MRARRRPTEEEEEKEAPRPYSHHPEGRPARIPRLPAWALEISGLLACPVASTHPVSAEGGRGALAAPKEAPTGVPTTLCSRRAALVGGAARTSDPDQDPGSGRALILPGQGSTPLGQFPGRTGPISARDRGTQVSEGAGGAGGAAGEAPVRILTTLGRAASPTRIIYGRRVKTTVSSEGASRHLGI